MLPEVNRHQRRQHKQWCFSRDVATRNNYLKDKFQYSKTLNFRTIFCLVFVFYNKRNRLMNFSQIVPTIIVDIMQM